MSILSRLMGRRNGDDYAGGVALFEQGKYMEAVAMLRDAMEHTGGASGSLGEFYLRQALVKEGRRRLVAGDAAGAVPCFGEAASRWSTYPDLHFWHGIALADTSAWDDALACAREALRFNNDYVEARLLEAGCLLESGHADTAAESLNALLASGRRVEHPLIRFLADRGPFDADNLPSDLPAMLRGTIHEKRDDEEVSAAVERCRTGDWEEGIAKLRSLCEANPTYPDYRVKLAGALFQTGRNTEALTEITQALVLNPRYRSAAHLKALILADQHRFAEAREVMHAQAEHTDPVAGHPGEELFCSYLGAVISLLTGRNGEARAQLRVWGDLSATFPTAELLIAACDDLDGRDDEAHQRFEALADKWFVDADYHYFLACHHAKCGRWDRVVKVLESWPEEEPGGEPDGRRLYLSALAKVAGDVSLAEDDLPADLADEPSWRLLTARSLIASEQWVLALQHLRELAPAGETTERLARLIMRAYLAVDEAGDVPLPEAVSDALLQDRICLLHRQERTNQALAHLRGHRELHPEDMRWIWLDPNFWLEPVRRWIG